MMRTMLPSNPETAGNIGLTNICYDVNDAAVLTTTAAGRVVETTRDGLGRPTEVSATSLTADPVVQTLQYDSVAARAVGRLASRTDETGLWKFHYDAFGRMERTDLVVSAFAIAFAGVGASATYAYDLQGALDDVTLDVNDAPHAYHFDKDGFGRVLAVSNELGAVVDLVEYDAYDRAERAHLDTTQTAWSYDPLSEVLESVHAFGPGEPASFDTLVSYTHDENLNLLSELREDSAEANGVSSSKFHDYDAQDRLSASAFEADGTFAVEGYEYTAGGTITRVHRDPLGTTDYVYVRGSGTVSPQATVAVTRGGIPNRSLSYDDDGFALTDGDATLSFDGLGCLREMDAGGRRAARTCGPSGDEVISTKQELELYTEKVDLFGLGELRRDVFGGNELRVRVTVNGSVIAEDRWHAETGALVEQQFVHMDARGSVLSTTTKSAASAQLDAAIEYDPWGADIAGDALPDRRFVDHEPDAFGNYVFGRRVYDPTLRRWLSPDPLFRARPDVASSDARQLDLHGYAANNPVLLKDTTGGFPIVAAVFIVVGVMSIKSDTEVIDENGDVLGGADLTFAFPVAGDLRNFDASTETLIEGIEEENNAKMATGASGMVGHGSMALVDALLLKGLAGYMYEKGSTPREPGALLQREKAPPDADSGGGRTGRKVSRHAREAGQKELDAARTALSKAKAKPNKTPADKEELRRLLGQVKKAESKLKASEEHARKQQGPSR